MTNPRFSDPILNAIAAYKNGIAAFNALPDDDDSQYLYLWQVPHATLQEWTAPAQTREGAIAALELAVQEEAIGDSELTAPMMKAALGFLEGAS